MPNYLGGEFDLQVTTYTTNQQKEGKREMLLPLRFLRNVIPSIGDKAGSLWKGQ